jgi:hypothetical protein
VKTPALAFSEGSVAVKRTSRKTNPARRIAALLKVVEDKFKGDVKCTIGDYIRLLQAQQEFDRDTPRDIEVTWVDSLEAKNESET